MTSQMSIDERNQPVTFNEQRYYGRFLLHGNFEFVINSTQTGRSRPFIVECVRSEIVPRYQTGYAG